MASRSATSASSQQVDLSTGTLKDKFRSLGIDNILPPNDRLKFNGAVEELKEELGNMPSCTFPFFCCYYLIAMIGSPYVSSDLNEKITDVVKEMAEVVKSLDEAERLPPCPELSRDIHENTYLSLRDVGRLVIDKIFPNSRGIFTQDALVKNIGILVGRAIRSQAGRGPISRIAIRKYNGLVFRSNKYLESDYPVIFKTIHDWMMTWKDNHTEVEKYVSFL